MASHATPKGGMDAKAWYEINQEEENLFIPLGVNLSPMKVKPDWERTYVSSDKK